MNPLAQELNKQLQENNPYLFDMLSELGKRLFFPKGILSQSAEAKKSAHKFNATIGIALENGEAMHLDCIHEWIKDLPPGDIFPYAPAAGKPALREKWHQKQLDENPSMQKKQTGMPIVTNALTHGLTLVGDLFTDPGDTVLLPDKFWGNYRLIFNVRKKARLVTFPFYNESNGFNLDEFQKSIQEQTEKNKKLIVILNFPNNPCGYSITVKEAEAISRILIDASQKGAHLIVVLDEAYFGLFYDDSLLKESLMGSLVNQNERLVVIKLDGATKEEFVWGFRVGFLTFGLGSQGDLDILYNALEKKIMGAIRGSISNGPHLSQTLVLKALESPDFVAQRAEKFDLLETRAHKVMQILTNQKYRETWTVYPFNSGYFMCLKIKGVKAEPLRKHLLEQYGVGVIAPGDDYDIRVAFSCIDEGKLEELFEIIYQGIIDLKPAE